jgi:hypothetical protein
MRCPNELGLTAVCDEATVSFNSIEVCARFANGQLEVFTSGSAPAVSGAIEIAVPYTASPQLQTTAAQAAGKMLVIQRGASSFQDKAERAQAAGAVGAIIVNNVAGDPMAMGGNYTAIRIPVVMVPLSADTTLRASQGLLLTIAAKREGAAGTIFAFSVPLCALSPFGSAFVAVYTLMRIIHTLIRIFRTLMRPEPIRQCVCRPGAQSMRR